MEPSKAMCQEIDIFLEKKRCDPNSPWADPQGSFLESKECGCRYCYAACHSVGDGVIVEENMKNSQDAVVSNSGLNFSRAHVAKQKELDVVSTEFRGSGVVFGNARSSKEVFVMDRADDPIIPVSASISGYTGSEKSLAIAFEWLKGCVREHTNLCPRLFTPLGKYKLPFRVLDVLEHKSQDIRLVETEDLSGHYACLSHCWGGKQPLVTTLDPDTLSAHKRGIPWADLPKTFQDAITVTRKFDIQYLWIDSLCILQDDYDDWCVQSSFMGEMYQNAVITIAGSASSGPEEGLFRTADVDHKDVPLMHSSIPQTGQMLRTRKPLSHAALQLPLLQRGWVFQERLLSPRYLHFSHNELIWECMERVTCECGGLSLQDTYQHRWLEPKNRLHPDSLYHLKNIPNRITTAWRAAVEDYSRMNLTKPEDMLPAISGIAKTVQDVTGWTYIAGMWRETLLTDLLWRTKNPGTAGRCKDWRAPTFSWASVVNQSQKGARNQSCIDYDIMVHLRHGMDEKIKDWRTDFYATVVGTGCEPVGGDITGQLKSGFILLRGKLIEANLIRSATGTREQWQLTPVGKEPLEMAQFFPDGTLEHERYGLSLAASNKVHCLKLVGSSKTANALSREYLIYLVLKQTSTEGVLPSDGLESCTFERIALYQDAKDPDGLQLEEASEESNVRRGAVVRIV